MMISQRRVGSGTEAGANHDGVHVCKDGGTTWWVQPDITLATISSGRRSLLTETTSRNQEMEKTD